MKIKAEGIKLYSGDKCRLPETTFSLEDNECAVLTGRSGSGKTTLLRVLAGLEKPSAGAVSYIDGSVEQEPEHLMKKGNLSFLFQENRLLPELSAIENIRIILPGEQKKDTETIIHELSRILTGVDLECPIEKLSGGELRRVACVRAMIRNVPVVLLDEPFTGLDEAAGEQVRRYITEESRGRIVIAAEHEGEHFPEWKTISL